MRSASLLLVLVVGSTGVATAGTVAGRVVFRGEPPVIQQFPVTKDRETCGEVTAADALVVSRANRGVEMAVVFLEGVGPVANGPPPGEVVLENRGCRFVPRVLAMRVGVELAIVNADPVLHNLRAWLPERRHVFNVVQPTQGQVSRRTIKRPGVMTLTCDTHVHMVGYLLAFEHPYFAVTDASGAFRIPAVPPGAYRITAWHEGWNVERRDPDGRLVYERARLLSREVVVPESGEVSLTFELTPRP
jgi:plastocyanin